MDNIFQEIVTKEMGLLAAGAIAVMLFLGRVPLKDKKLNQTKMWKNWGIFLLVGICTAGSFAPGVNDIPISEWGGILVFAFVSSMVALLGRAVLKPIILKRLEGKGKDE
jgi:hypothetical protein